jgi:ubiquinone/menaquinone biosynthesis C-methylase UbiE
MDNQKAYNEWATKYDNVSNKTRDLEANAFRTILSNYDFDKVIEIGCGTGKNTIWLISKAKEVLGVDFSEEMLQKAKEKINNPNVQLQQADIRNDWDFIKDNHYELVTCSLVLEHIENIHHIFEQSNKKLKKGGLFYIGEYHPFKQYLGKKARFEHEGKVVELECFTHHLSEFYETSQKHDFECISLKEWFDNHDISSEPRVLTMVFRKK